jgi:hypothetical protein
MNDLTKVSFFAIAQEHRALVEKLSDMDLDEQTLADTLSGESYPLEKKAENVCFVVRHAQMQIQNLDAEIERLSNLRKAIAGHESKLMKYIDTCMTVAQVKSLEAGTFKLTRKANPPKCELLDERQIPAEFMVIPDAPPMTVDKKALLAALKKLAPGESIPGAKIADTSLRLELR